MRLQATGAAVGGALLLWRWGGYAFGILAGILAVFALCAWLAPERYRPIQRVFDFLTRVLVSAVSWFLLALVYFGIFTPAGLISGLFGWNPMHRRSGGAVTNLLPLSPQPPEHFKRQY
jgi:hypothetical protein